MSRHGTRAARSRDPTRYFGGEGEIRTRDRIAPMPVFKTGAFNRSATSPSEATAAVTNILPYWTHPRPPHYPSTQIGRPIQTLRRTAIVPATVTIFLVSPTSTGAPLHGR